MLPLCYFQEVSKTDLDNSKSIIEPEHEIIDIFGVSDNSVRDANLVIEP